jgi:hypothetical protein
MIGERASDELPISQRDIDMCDEIINDYAIDDGPKLKYTDGLLKNAPGRIANRDLEIYELEALVQQCRSADFHSKNTIPPAKVSWYVPPEENLVLLTAGRKIDPEAQQIIDDGGVFSCIFGEKIASPGQVSSKNNEEYHYSALKIFRNPTSGEIIALCKNSSYDRETNFQPREYLESQFKESFTFVGVKNLNLSSNSNLYRIPEGLRSLINISRGSLLSRIQTKIKLDGLDEFFKKNNKFLEMEKITPNFRKISDKNLTVKPKNQDPKNVIKDNNSLLAATKNIDDVFSSGNFPREKA